MSHAQFAILRHQPYAARTEHVNIGVVVFMPEGGIRVRMASNLRKLRAFDPSVDLDVVRSQELAIPELMAGLSMAETRSFLQRLGPWRLNAELGTLEYASAEELDAGIEWALVTACEPGQPKLLRERPPTSRLYVDLKRTFDTLGWLGKTQQSISEHLIVAHFPISMSEGLVADFALKNGSLHVLETVDLRDSSNPSVKRAQAQAKALLLSVAAAEDSTVKTVAVVAGSAGNAARPTMRLLERFSTDLYAYESSSDMQTFFGRCAAALGKPLLTPPLGT